MSHITHQEVSAQGLIGKIANLIAMVIIHTAGGAFMGLSFYILTGLVGIIWCSFTGSTDGPFVHALTSFNILYPSTYMNPVVVPCLLLGYFFAIYGFVQYYAYKE